jgi:hypothetical protein
MTDDERSDAYHEALRNYADVKAHTSCSGEAFIVLLVAEKVLSSHPEFDPALTYFRECCSP